MKLMILVTHLLGSGHLSRALTLARAAAAAGAETTVVSGGKPAAHLTADDVRLVQLPPLSADGVNFRRLLTEDGAEADAAYLMRRRRLIADSLATFEPDALVLELWPFGRRGLSAEFLAAIEAARATTRAPALICSIRDVLAAPSKPQRIEETAERVDTLLDAVLVHGDPALLPLEASWPGHGRAMPAQIAAKLRYTGYIAARAPRAGAAPPPRSDEVLVAAGGGPVGDRLFEAAAGAARLRPQLGWRLLVGGGEDRLVRLRARLSAADAPARLSIEAARPDYPALLARAACSVSQAGYNTALDLIAARPPTVLVPFEEGGETEQRLRAEGLGTRAGAVMLREAEIDAPRLATAVDAAIARGPLTPPPIDLDGAGASAAIISEIVAARPPEASAAAHRGAARGAAAIWSALDDELSAWADAGLTLKLWWRDDDAVEPTPALDRLLALAADHNAPLAVAAIPSRATQALATRLAAEPAALVLPHGWAHANHAAAGRRKSEFGVDRPLPARLDDARRGWTRISTLFGAQARPIFTPPWNRLELDMATGLAAAGFAGLSVYGPRPSPTAAPGLALINTHIDPIDWRGTRSARSAEALVHALTTTLAARRRGLADPTEPIGLLTHHLAHDEAIWDLIARLADRFSARGDAVRWSAPGP